MGTELIPHIGTGLMHGISIDPGKDRSWIAVWGIGRKLINLHVAEGSLADQVRYITDTHSLGNAFSWAACEAMTHYANPNRGDTRGAQFSKAKALLELQQIGTALAVAATGGRGHLATPTASQWKGQLTKAVCERRILGWTPDAGPAETAPMYRPGALTPTELEIYNRFSSTIRPSWRHNIVDSIGIGLHVIGRGIK